MFTHGIYFNVSTDWLDYNSYDIYNLIFSIQYILGKKEGKKEMLYLKMHSTHFIYGYMASDIYGKGPFR